MAKLTSYATVTTLLDGMWLYTAIDTDADDVFESRKFSLSVLRAELNNANSTIVMWSKGSDIASATALPMGTDGNQFDVTGTTAITSFSTPAAVLLGTLVMLEFDGILTLTHHATDLVLPGALNIVTEAGDKGFFHQYATGDWKCLQYTRAADAPRPTGFNTPMYIDAAPQALSGAGAVDIVSPVTNFTSTGATDALTLVDSTVVGQVKILNHSVDGGGYVLTPTTLSGGTTITVTDPAVSITLMWTALGWRLMGQTGVATIA